MKSYLKNDKILMLYFSLFFFYIVPLTIKIMIKHLRYNQIYKLYMQGTF